MIGWHVSRSDFNECLSGSRELPVAQIFLRSPRQGFADPKMSDEEKKLVSVYAMRKPLYVHAPYTIVPFKDSSKIKQYGKALSKDIAFAMEIKRIRGIVVHEGTAAKTQEDVAVIAAKTFAAAFEYAGVKKGARFVPKILVENSVKGRVPAEFASLVSSIREHLRSSEDTRFMAAKIGMCYDTQHAYARNTDILDSTSLISEIREIERNAGKIDLIHFNDSAVSGGSGVDRHETPGHGCLFESEEELKQFVVFLKKENRHAVIERPEIVHGLLDTYM